MTSPISFTPTLRQKILFVIPFIGIIPSYLFERAIQREIREAGKTVRLLQGKSELLNIDCLRDCSSAILSFGLLLASDRIKKKCGLLFSILGTYFIYSAFKQGLLAELNEKEILCLIGKRTPSPH